MFGTKFANLNNVNTFLILRIRIDFNIETLNNESVRIIGLRIDAILGDCRIKGNGLTFIRDAIENNR